MILNHRNQAHISEGADSFLRSRAAAAEAGREEGRVGAEPWGGGNWGWTLAQHLWQQ